MKTKLLIIGLLFMSAVSCTPEPAQKCEVIIQAGYTAKDVCVIILESEKIISVPCGTYKIGDTYCY